MKILIVTPSNVGDAVLSTGTIAALKSKFPEASLDILTSTRAQGVFLSDCRINRIYIYQKTSSLLKKSVLFKKLRDNKYNFTVDLKNMFFSFIISNRVLRSANLNGHMYLKHNSALKSLISIDRLKKFKPLVLWKSEDQEKIDSYNLNRYIVLAPIAKSITKTWPLEHYREFLGLFLKEYPDISIVVIGDSSESNLAGKLVIDERVKDLAGKTTVAQAAYLIKNAVCVITNDSAALHLASACNALTLALFGPTSSDRYGPLSDNSCVVQKFYPCAPCQKAQCSLKDRRCLVYLKPDYVFSVLKDMIRQGCRYPAPEYKRILLSRTDRIGDLVLTTPAIEAVYRKFPGSYICFMSGIEAGAIIKNNPYIDEIIYLDKKWSHSGISGFLKLLKDIKQRKFDLAVNFHPTNRNHLLCFLANIPNRVGYDCKIGCLNNKIVKHLKQKGEKSESEYNFELLDTVGIKNLRFNQLIIPDREALKWAQSEINRRRLKDFIIIHPGASCKSKIWPVDNFIELAVKTKPDFDIVFILGPSEAELKIEIEKKMPGAPVFYKIPLDRLIALISKSYAMISNDSGPMHIADAFNKPLIAIFGRNQAGLSHKRWGPLGDNATVVYEDSGCKDCLAHNCKRDFVCLKNITVDTVYNRFKDIMGEVKL